MRKEVTGHDRKRVTMGDKEEKVIKLTEQGFGALEGLIDCMFSYVNAGTQSKRRDET